MESEKLSLQREASKQRMSLCLYTSQPLCCFAVVNMNIIVLLLYLPHIYKLIDVLYMLFSFSKQLLWSMACHKLIN